MVIFSKILYEEKLQKKAGGSVTHITNYSLEHMLEVLNYWGKFHTEFLIYSCSDIIQGRKRAINICKKKEGSFIQNSIVFPANEL